MTTIDMAVIFRRNVRARLTFLGRSLRGLCEEHAQSDKAIGEKIRVGNPTLRSLTQIATMLRVTPWALLQPDFRADSREDW